MKPANFKEATITLQKPAEMTDEECTPLPIWNDGKQCISLWRMSWKERISALVFGRIWLGVLSGVTQPPVWLDATKTVFTKHFFKERVKDFFSAFLSGFKQSDKLKHFAVGFIIAFFFGLINPLIGLSLAVLAGIGKEVYDKVSKKGTPEYLDFIFTAIGGLLGFANIYLVKILILLIIK